MYARSTEAERLTLLPPLHRWLNLQKLDPTINLACLASSLQRSWIVSRLLIGRKLMANLPRGWDITSRSPLHWIYTASWAQEAITPATITECKVEQGKRGLSCRWRTAEGSSCEVYGHSPPP